MATPDSTTKQCCRCAEIKPLSAFYKDKHAPDGYAYRCIECYPKRMHRPVVASGYKRCSRCGNDYPATPEYFVKDTRKKQGISSPCLACYRAYSRDLARTPEQRAKHYAWCKGDSRRQYMRRYVRALLRTPEERTKRKQYKRSKRGREVALLSAQRRRARKRQLPDTLTAEQWRLCVDYFDQRCVYCGSTGNVTIDHLIPLSAEHCPGTVATNVVPACTGCNCSKNDRDVRDFLTDRFGITHAERVLDAIAAYIASIEGYPK